MSGSVPQPGTPEGFREAIRNAIDGNVLTWCRMRSGRQYHARLNPASGTAVCAAQPSDGSYSGWIPDTTKRPERRVCVKCSKAVDAAIAEVVI